MKVPTPQKHLSLDNVHAFMVVDARPDTVPIGFMQKHPLNHAFIELNKSVRQETENFINDYFQFSKTDSTGIVVMILKKMWLTDELDIIEDDFLNDKKKGRGREYTSGIKMKAEFYYKKEADYYPLYRYDSVFTDSFSVTVNGPYYIHDAIISSLSKLSSIDNKLSDLRNKRKLSWEEIRQHKDDDFNIPVLKDTNLRRGVYATFDEFKNNNPSEINFEVRTERMSDILYIKQPDGKEFVARDNWGYCDGHKIFIRSSVNFFTLQRVGNAFYIYGSKTLNRKHPSHLKLTLMPFQLDWDTGNLN